MIVYSVFPGDDDEKLMWMQHDLYMNEVGFLFAYARTRYIEASKLIKADLVLTEILKSIKGFDHRVLQEAHDIIAAFYRYDVESANQLPLFRYAPCYKSDPLADKWDEYFGREVKRLINVDDDFCRDILTAVVYQNTETGYAAERRIRDRLIMMYDVKSWAHADGHLAAGR